MENLETLQKEAVQYTNGSLIVLAGPGTGKTRVLTHRIVQILNESKGQRFKIVALTFTNKAAEEMRIRIEKSTNENLNRVFIGTFHGFAYKTLKSYSNYIGIPSDFIIYDRQEDLFKILKDGIWERVQRERRGVEKTLLSIKYPEYAVLEKSQYSLFQSISKIKNNALYQNNLVVSETEQAIFDIYENELKRYNVLDFTDLLIHFINLFKNKKFIRSDYQKIYKHILIDEGQDINSLQLEFIKQLAGEQQENLFVVADEDQVIYEWNDARFEYLLEIQRLYNTKTIQLYETFRSPAAIVELANSLISNNTKRLDNKKKLVSKRDKKNGVYELNSFPTQTDEIDFVCETIKKIGVPQECAVITRNRSLFKQISDKFKTQNISYHIPSQQDRFVSREINLLLYVLKVIVNENDKIAIYHICNYYNLDYNEITETDDVTLLQSFCDTISETRSELANQIQILRNDKNEVFNSNQFTALQKIIVGEYDETEENDLKADIEALQKQLRKFINSDELQNLSNFINFLALYKGEKTKNGVALLTGHAAKGLEFDYVFVVSLNEGIFPDFRAKDRALEEERRNCYVAITRTKKKLFMSYTNAKETRYGMREHQPSRFLREMKLI